MAQRTVLVELTTTSANHRTFTAPSHLRANRIRLDNDLSSQQIQQRKSLSLDFLGLNIRGFESFFMRASLRDLEGHWNGAHDMMRLWAKGGAIKTRTPTSRRDVDLQFLAVAWLGYSPKA